MPQGDATVVNQETITWVPEGTADVVEPVAAPAELTTPVQKLKEPLFIPQGMEGYLEVTYTIASEDGAEFTEKKVLKLNELKDKEDKALSDWEPAKHYIYNIVISTEEILIDASVENWVDVEIPVEVK